MLARALIVLLVVLNLGVAAWWLTRDDPAPVAAAAPAGDAPPLRLLREVPRSALAKSAAAPASSSTAVESGAVNAEPESGAQRCHAFGPFDNAASVEAAREGLQPRVTRLSVRRTEATQATGGDWRVWLPPLADRAAAQVMVDRIAAAGFSDYYIFADGEEANGIALGLYGSEATARRREAALRAGGFGDVRAEAMNGSPPLTWIDVAAGAGFDAAAARSALGVAEVVSIDCGSVP